MHLTFERFKEKVPAILYICLALCAFFQPIQIVCSNIFQGASFFFFLLYFYFNKEDVIERFKKYRFLFYIYLVFILAFIPSVLYGPTISKGLSVWLSLYVLRPWLGFIILLSVKNIRSALLIFGALLAGFAVTALYALISQGNPNYGYRYTGIYGHPMIFAGFACTIIPVLIVGSYAKELSKGLRIASFIFFCLSVFALIMNATRGAWIAAAVSFLIASAVYFRQAKKLVSACVIVVGAIFCFGATEPLVMQRVFSLADSSYQSNSERVLMWRSAYKMFEDHPIQGVGMGNYTSEYQNHYILPEAKERELTRAHSNIFQILGENGGAGLAGFVFFFAALLIYCLRQFAQTKSDFYFVAFLSTLALMIQGLTEFNLAHSNLMKYFWELLGVCFILASLPKDAAMSFLKKKALSPNHPSGA